MSFEELNKDTQERFLILRRKLKLNVVESFGEDKVEAAELRERTIKNTLKQEDWDKLSDPTKQISAKEAEEIIKAESFINNSFDFIDSLNLPPQLSLAIGLIISHSKTGKMEEISSACQILEDYIIGKGKEIGVL